MKKLFHAVPKGRVPGIYKTWSLAKGQVSHMKNVLILMNGLMVVNDDHSEDNIKVFEQRVEHYTL